MDEGLRLARMVSHDRAGKLGLGLEGPHTTGDFSKFGFTYKGLRIYVHKPRELRAIFFWIFKVNITFVVFFFA